MHARALLARRLRVVVLRGASGATGSVVCAWMNGVWPVPSLLVCSLARCAMGGAGGLAPRAKICLFSSQKRNLSCVRSAPRRGGARRGWGCDDMCERLKEFSARRPKRRRGSRSCTWEQRQQRAPSFAAARRRCAPPGGACGAVFYFWGNTGDEPFFWNIDPLPQKSRSSTMLEAGLDTSQPSGRCCWP